MKTQFFGDKGKLLLDLGESSIKQHKMKNIVSKIYQNCWRRQAPQSIQMTEKW